MADALVPKQGCVGCEGGVVVNDFGVEQIHATVFRDGSGSNDLGMEGNFAFWAKKCDAGRIRGLGDDGWN